MCALNVDRSRENKLRQIVFLTELIRGSNRSNSDIRKKKSILYTIKVSNLNNYSLLRYFFSQRSKFYLYPILCSCLFGYSAILKVIFTLLPAVLLNTLYSLSCRHPYQVIVDPTYLY